MKVVKSYLLLFRQIHLHRFLWKIKIKNGTEIEKIYIDEDNREFNLTKDNVEFPTHFHLTSKESGAVDICNNDEIREIINRGINYFRKNKDEFVWYYESGNIHLSIYKYDGDEQYYIIVSDKYYSTYIDFESEDY